MTGLVGILLVNLGTPNSPENSDVYRYLIEFLTDERVIDFPWLKRQLLTRGVIVPFRFRNSAKSYREIWSENGSPLLVYGRKVAELLNIALGDSFVVKLAMRYQNPPIASSLEFLREKNVSEIIVLPLFPQYASASTGSCHQEVMRVVSKWQTIPKMTMINSYPTLKGMIDTFCERAKQHPLEIYDHFVFSFHGLPERQILKADRNHVCLQSKRCCEQITEKNQFCYLAQCHQTANAIINQLNIDRSLTSISFQSRLGRDPWLEPFTIDILTSLAEQGKKNVLVFCPAFVADCLETIYEIIKECKESFVAAGGSRLDLVESLNDHPLWVEALKNMLLDQVQVFEDSVELSCP